MEEDQFPQEMESIDPYQDSEINDAYEPIITVNGNKEYIQFPDGSMHVGELEDENVQHEQNPQDFFENLANVFDDVFLDNIGNELNQLIDDDQESQLPFMTTLSDCINLLGINPEDEDNRGDLPFANASNVNSMTLFDTLLHLESIIYNSVFSNENFITCIVTGESTPQLEDISTRKQMYFNNYLNNVAKEFKKEVKRSIKWSISAGSNYKKVYIDPLLNRPTSVCILPNDFVVNRAYPTHLVAPRKTHIFKVSERDLEFYFRKKIYKKVDLGTYKQNDTDNPITEVLNQISSNDDSFSYDNSPIDQLYKFRECHCLLELPNDIFAQDAGIPVPYIVTLEEESGKIVRIVRNWKPNDPDFTPREFFVNYPFMTSFDGEGYGMVHYAKRLGETATGIFRLMVNSAILANYPGGLFDNSLRVDSSDFRPAPGEFKGINTQNRPISDVIMKLPYSDPSPVLREILMDIENAIRRPAAIVSEEMVGTASKAPMGTVLWMFENMQRVPNMLLQNFYDSFKQELSLFNQRFFEWMPEDGVYPFKVPGGETVIMKQDFDDSILVIPEGEPNLKNTSYGFLQAQAIVETAKEAAQYHNMPGVFYYYYKTMGLAEEQINQILLPPPQEVKPFSGDPVTENTMLLTGKAVEATLPQEHPSHIVTHHLILADPNTPPEVKAATLAHIQDHTAKMMMVQMQTAMGIQIPQDPSQMSLDEQNHIALMAARVAKEQLAQMEAQNQPPPPQIDPIVAQIEIEQMILAQKREAEDMKYKYEMNKLELEKEKINRESELAYEKLKLDDKKIELEFTHKENKRVSEEITEHEKIRNIVKQKKED